MTTFTSEDRANATKYLDEAPYHPGYEDVVPAKQMKLDFGSIEEQNSFLRKRILELENELEEYRQYTERHLLTAKNIIDSLKR